MVKREVNQMRNQSMATLPIPEVEEKKLMQAEINLDLYQAVEKERKVRELSKRKVLEWGLRAFLLTSNPKAARDLGIKGNE